MTYPSGGLICASASSVSIATPRQLVSCFDHFVTQWISVCISVCSRLLSDSHDQVPAVLPAISIEKSQVLISTLGVGPADKTGKPSSRYWPGGTGRVGVDLRRPKKLSLIMCQPVLRSVKVNYVGSVCVNQSGFKQYIVSIIVTGSFYWNERKECCSET